MDDRCPRASDIDRHEAELRELRAALRSEYVLREVYRAERDDDRRRIQRLEDHDTSQVAGGRAWVLGIGLALVGALCGILAQLITARGGH